MSEPVDLLLFGHLMQKPERELDLERAALLVAETEYPGLPVADYMAKLDHFGHLARQRLRAAGMEPTTAAPADAMPAILRLMYQELRFRGNVAEYYDPRNSFLNQVIDRRTGIPLTLAIVLLAICRRAGVEARGLSFPGHFLVRTTRADGEPVFIDPFDGRPLEPAQLHALYESATGDPGEIDERFLEAPSAGRSSPACSTTCAPSTRCAATGCGCSGCWSRWRWSTRPRRCAAAWTC